MFVNNTPFPGMAYNNFNARRMLTTTTVVRGRFRLHVRAADAPWLLRPDPEQGGLEVEARYENNDPLQAMQHDSDYLPYKAATDLILSGQTYAPGNTPQPQWSCGLRVDNAQGTVLEKQLRVSGPRHWKKGWRGWKISDAEAVSQVALHPRNAYGGGGQVNPTAANPEGHSETHEAPWFAANPLGKGWMPPNDPNKQCAAPQLLYPDAQLEQIEDQHRPAHLGWISPIAPQRVQQLGTQKSHPQPFLPQDFDERYYQGAPDDQQIRPHLKGDETITLFHLLPGIAEQTIQLPDYQLVYRYHFADRAPVAGRLLLDTVFLSLADPDATVWRVELTWRSRTPAATDSARTEAQLMVPPDPPNVTDDKEIKNGR